MHNGNTWELPFSDRAELELHTHWGSLSLVAVESGQTPRLELTHGSADTVAVHIEKVGETVRVALDPHRSGDWFGGGWECRATVYVPRDVRAHVQTNAGRVRVADLAGCELAIKANAGKIELNNVRGLLHLSADAGSVTGRAVGGYFDVETQAGSVALEIADLQPGEHRIRATAGSIRLELARGLDVCLETHTSLGSVRNSYPANRSAPARLLVSTEMGSLRVSEGSAPWSGSRPASSSSSSSSYPPIRPTAGSVPPVRPAAAPPAARQDPELDRVLQMVEAGELSAHDADELLRAMGRV